MGKTTFVDVHGNNIEDLGKLYAIEYLIDNFHAVPSGDGKGPYLDFINGQSVLMDDLFLIMASWNDDLSLFGEDYEELTLSYDDGDIRTGVLVRKNRTFFGSDEASSKCAYDICSAIKKLASNDDALSNFESYLSYHIDAWFQEFVTCPGDLASEFKHFANIYED